MSLISSVKKLWNNGITKKWFLAAIFICFTIPILSLIIFYTSGRLYIYDAWIFRWNSLIFLEKFEVLMVFLLLLSYLHFDGLFLSFLQYASLSEYECKCLYGFGAILQPDCFTI